MAKIDINMNIVYEDTELIIVDKPSGLLSVPGRGSDKQDCVVNRTKLLFPGIIDQPAVHRLDMYTSGLMILAKTEDTHKHLSQQFERRCVKKKYIALLEGSIEADKGEIRLAFRLDPDNRPYQVYDPVQGKLGITRWKRLKKGEYRTRIEFTPITGRTHQLRLHAAHPKGLGAPIVGDQLYGNGRQSDRMLLHAFQLQFHHPKNGNVMRYESEAPF
jgi:tRNA pseudouridine32 synthase/23S rRNA pseudouridine746 synthase